MVISFEWERLSLRLECFAGMIPPLLSFVRQDFLRDQDGARRVRPSGIESQMSDDFNELFFFDTVLHSEGEMKAKLIGAVHRDQRRYRGKTAIALREFWTFPDVIEEHLVGELDEFRREVAK